MMAGLGKVHGGAVGHGGAGYAYNVETIFVKPRDHAASITWTDPCDDRWAGTKIVRKTGGYPESMTDGVLVVDSQIRNQYAQEGFLDTGLVNEETYYYMAFPYSNAGVNTSHYNYAIPVSPMNSGVLAYTGAHTVTDVEWDGYTWEQWTLTGDGTLRLVSGRIPSCKVWLCSGGSCGMHGTSARYGGRGGFAVQSDSYEINADVAVSIGRGSTAVNEASGATKFGTLTAPGVTRLMTGMGGSGGGSSSLSGFYGLDLGDGQSKYPFRDEVYFAGKPHCAGGGGGATYIHNDNVVNPSQSNGGAGGSNGGNGLLADYAVVNYSPKGGSGGLLGGGQGGDATRDGNNYGKNADFYGGGGGGTGFYEDNRPGSRHSNFVYTSGGSGYQGVVYVRIQKTYIRG